MRRRMRVHLLQIKEKSMKKEQIPNVLTIGRILFIPLFILILTLGHSQGSHLLAAIIFAVASITDYLDGYLARKWNVVSNFGKFADPMADKLLVMSAFIMLIELGMAPAWVVAIIICRELAVTGLRLLLVEMGGTVLAAAMPGKKMCIRDRYDRYNTKRVKLKKKEKRKLECLIGILNF